MRNNLARAPYDHVEAPHGARFNAFTVDCLFAATLSQLASTLLNSLIGIESEVVTNILITTLYYALPLTISGQTIGKKIFGLRVLPAGEDRKLTIREALTRELLGKTLSFLSVFGIPMILMRSDRKALHDLISKTEVVQESAVAEKGKGVFTNLIKSAVVSLAISALSLGYLYYSPMFATLIETRLTAQGIKVQKVSGSFAKGFQFNGLELKLDTEKIEVGSLQLRLDEYAKLVFEQKLTFGTVKISGINLKNLSGDPQASLFGLLALPFLDSTIVGSNQPKFQLKAIMVKNFELEDSTFAGKGSVLSVRLAQLTDFKYDTTSKVTSWNSLSLKSSAIDLETKHMELAASSVSSSFPIVAKLYALPGIKLKLPIDLAASFNYSDKKFERLQLNALQNKITLTSESGKPFQLWVTSIDLSNYLDSVPFDNFSFYSSKTLALELLSKAPQTASFKIGNGQFVWLTNVDSAERIDAIYPRGDNEFHLKLPPGFLSALLAGAKPELSDQKGSHIEDILYQLGISQPTSVAKNFISQPPLELPRVPATAPTPESH